jgi:hypothetical protein
MTTNIQEAPPTKRPDQPVGIESTPIPVAVFDQGPDKELDPSISPSASMLDDAPPVKSQSSGSMIAWIIGFVLLIIIAYFVLQMFF